MIADRARPSLALSRYSLLVVGIAGLSMAGVFYSLASAPVVSIVAYRMLLAVAFMLPLAALSRAGATSQGRARFSRSDIVAAVAAGALFAVDLTVWAASLKFTTVANAALFVSTQPIFVAMLASLLLGERPTRLMYAGIAVGIAGVAVVGIQDLHLSGRALAGDLLALLAAFAETGYLLVGRHVRQRIDAPRYALVVYATGAACVWMLLAAGRVSPALSVRDFAMSLALAVVATVLGHTLVSQSLGYMPAAVVAVSFLAQPILAALFAFAFLGQAIAFATVLGGLVALGGIGLVAYANEKRGGV